MKLIYSYCIAFLQKVLFQAPFVGIFLCTCTGLIVQYYNNSIYTHQFVLATLVAYAVVLVVLGKIVRYNVYLIPVLCWFCLLGFLLPSFYFQEYTPLLGEQQSIVKIISPPTAKQKTYACEVETEMVKDTSVVSRAMIYVEKDSLSATLQYGDIIELQGTFQEIENMPDSDFDYKAWMAEQHMYSSAYIPHDSWVKHGIHTSLRRYAVQTRETALEHLQHTNINPEYLNIIAALVFGDKSYLQRETKEQFARVGAMHVLAVSGLHVGIVASIIVLLCSFLPPKTYFFWFKLIIIISGIWLYAFITGLSPSVQRASVMFSLFSIGIVTHRRTNSWNTLAAAAFISVFIEPYIVFQTGFQLSYIAVMSILYGVPKLQTVYIERTKIDAYVWGIVVVSIAVQIGTFPIAVYYFQHIPVYSVAANICIIPLAFIIIIAVFLCFVPIISLCAVQIVNMVFDLFTYIIDVVYELPHATVFCSFTQQAVFAMYATMLICIIVFELLYTLRVQKQRV
ncbi:MAG: ComEC/Rec2 family competence protein [Bacteroidales bacterium]